MASNKCHSRQLNRMIQQVLAGMLLIVERVCARDFYLNRSNMIHDLSIGYCHCVSVVSGSLTLILR